MQVIFDNPESRIVDSIVRSIPVPLSTHEEFKQKLNEIHAALVDNQEGRKRIQFLSNAIRSALLESNDQDSFEKDLRTLSNLSELLSSRCQQQGCPPLNSYTEESFWLAARHHDLCSIMATSIDVENTNNFRFEKMVEYLSDTLNSNASRLGLFKQEETHGALKNVPIAQAHDSQSTEALSSTSKSKRSIRKFLSDNADKIISGSIAVGAIASLGILLNELLPWLARTVNNTIHNPAVTNFIEQASLDTSNQSALPSLINRLLYSVGAYVIARKLLKTNLWGNIANRFAKLLPGNKRGLTKGGNLSPAYGGKLESEREDLESLLFTTHLESPTTNAQTKTIHGNFRKAAVPALASMPQRTAEEIDAYFNIISLLPNQNQELPTPIQFEITAYDGPGILEKSELGTYRITNLPLGKHTFTYRLTPRNTPLVISNTNTAEWLETPDREKYHPATYRAIYLAKLAHTREEGIKTLLEGLQAAGALYSTDSTILSLIKGSKAIEIADMMQIYLCDLISHNFTHNARVAGIPSSTVGGLQVKHTGAQYQFILSPGHQRSLYLNEKNEAIEVEPQDGMVGSADKIKPLKVGSKIKLSFKKIFLSKDTHVKVADIASEWRDSLFESNKELSRGAVRAQQEASHQLSGTFSYAVLGTLNNRLTRTGHITTDSNEAHSILESLPYVSPFTSKERELACSPTILDSRIDFQEIRKAFVEDLRLIFTQQPQKERTKLLQEQISHAVREKDHIGEWVNNPLMALEVISLVLEDPQGITLQSKSIITLLEKSLVEISGSSYDTKDSRTLQCKNLEIVCLFLETFGDSLRTRKDLSLCNKHLNDIFSRTIRLVNAFVQGNDRDEALKAADILKRIESLTHTLQPNQTHAVSKSHLDTLIASHSIKDDVTADEIQKCVVFLGKNSCLQSLITPEGVLKSDCTNLLSEMLYTDKVKFKNPLEIKQKGYFPLHSLRIAKAAGLDIRPLLDKSNQALQAYLDTFYFKPSVLLTIHGSPGGVIIKSPSPDNQTKYAAREFLTYDQGQNSNQEFYLFREHIGFGIALHAVFDDAQELIQELSQFRAEEAEAYAESLLRKHADAIRSIYYSASLIGQSTPRGQGSPWLSLPIIPSAVDHRGSVDTESPQYMTRILGLTEDMTQSWLNLQEQYPSLAQAMGHIGTDSFIITRALQNYQISASLHDKVDQLGLLLHTAFATTEVFDEIDSRISEIELLSKRAENLLLKDHEVTVQDVETIHEESISDSRINRAMQKILAPLSPYQQMQCALYLGWVIQNHMHDVSLTSSEDPNRAGLSGIIDKALSSVGTFTHASTFQPVAGTPFPIAAVMGQLNCNSEKETLRLRSRNFSAAISSKIRRFERFSQQSLSGSLSHIGSGMLVSELREYREGDELRKVDWKATARRGKLITKEMYDEDPKWSRAFVDLAWLKAGVSDTDIGKNIPLLMELLQSAVQSAQPISLNITMFGEPLLSIESGEIMRIMHERGTNSELIGKSDLLEKIWSLCLITQKCDLESPVGNVIIPPHTRLHAYETPILCCSKESIQATKYFVNKISGQKGFQVLQN
jgi:hypothetical protein